MNDRLISIYSIGRGIGKTYLLEQLSQIEQTKSEKKRKDKRAKSVARKMKLMR